MVHVTDNLVNVTGAFTLDQASRLSGLSKRQLSYWDETDVFTPSLVHGSPHQPYGRIYSFQDIVALRTLARLRERFPLNKLRELGHWLKSKYEHPWSSIRFYIAGHEIVYEDPNTKAMVSTRPLHQGAFAVELEPIAREAQESLRQNMLKREPTDIGQITRHRYTLRNDWVVAGTRIPVSLIQEMYLEIGYGIDEIVAEYPMLTPADVKAAIAFDPAEHQRPTG